MKLPDIEDLNPDHLSVYRERAAAATEQWHALRSNTDALQQELAAMRGTATSPDGYVSAVVNLQGLLQELDLDPRIYRQTDSEALAALVKNTVQKAAEDAAQRAQAVMDRLFPGQNLDALARGEIPSFPET
ncbi:YbaB/EbfC family nucleoid-associated protein [Kineosporia babensis]|uniref:YbaB/EbfC family nucleoid-associated protein n=1 Tax=Kineosporia babensis TaxID=499548 RepID=A0A9X1NAR3_9ACTN|nr:YbaB/EbfC family nucleoid-associated protein [Kineosporia babensis]